MKMFLGLLLAVGALSAQAESCGELTLKEHMNAMGFLLDDIYSQADKRQYEAAANNARELRGHLVKAIGMMPPKVSAIADPAQRDAAMNEFHKLLSRAIYLSASLEEVLWSGDAHTESGDRDKDFKNLLYELSVVAGEGHKRFR